jgi:hypothetical protein
MRIMLKNRATYFDKRGLVSSGSFQPEAVSLVMAFKP